MHDLDRSILATLAYYDGLGLPLTLMELHERLIPAERLGGRPIDPKISEVLERLGVLCAIGTVLQEDGLYVLGGAPEGFGTRRIEQEKIWAQKWRHMLRKAWWLQAVPFVRGIYASGSLAVGNTSATSDWDIFIVAQGGRLYTTRIGLLATAWLLRALRTKHDQTASDKFCFNHYVTTNGLSMRHRSIYVAHGLAVLVPIHNPHRYLERLWQANQWIGDFRPMPVQADVVRRSVRPSSLLNAIRRTFEYILSAIIGAALEQILRSWQKRRIAREPVTHERGGRIIADDRELEFHPRSFEAVALGRYNAAMERFGMGSHVEHDSGLRH